MADRKLNILFGADTTGFKKGINELRSGLTEVNTAYIQNKRKQKEVSNEMKALEKEQKELTKAIKAAGAPTKEQSQRAEELQKKLDEAALKAGRLKTKEQELKSEIAKTTKEIQEQKGAAEKNAFSMEKAGKALKKAAQFTGTAMSGLFVATAGFAASADDINTLSKQTGLATDEIQKFMYASQLIDVELETLTGSMAKLVRNMNTASKGTGDAYEAFKALGVSIKDDVTGNLRNNQDVFDECIAALGKIQDETQRDAYAMSIFGKSAQELNPLILGGTEQLKQFGDELEREGLILDQMQLDKLNEFNDKIDTFKAKFQAKMMESSVDWVDAFDELLDKSDEIVDLVATLITGFAKVTGFIVDHKEAVLALAGAYGVMKGYMNVKSLISSVVTSVKSLTSATKGATTAQIAFNSAAKAMPYIALASALAMLISKIYNVTTSAKESSKEMEEYTSEFASSVDDARNRIEEETIAAQQNVVALKQKADRYEELRKKASLTAEEEQELYNIASDLEAAYPNQISLIDAKTLSYKEMGNQLDILTNQILENAKAQAKQNALTSLYEDEIGANSEISKIEDVIDEYKNRDGVDYLTLYNDNTELFDFENLSSSLPGDVAALLRRLMKERQTLQSIKAEIKKLESEISDDNKKKLLAGGEDIKNLAAAVELLLEKYTLLSSAEKELKDTHELSSETLNTITAKYPSLLGVVNDYLSGLASGEDVINRLSLAYEKDVENNANAFQQKLNTDTEYYQKLQQMNDTYINELATEYGVDLSNYQNYAEAKLAIEKAFLTAKAKNWEMYYDAESQRYKITDKDLMQYKKELYMAGYSDEEVEEFLAKQAVYKQEYLATQNAVNAWKNVEDQLDDSIVDYSKYYIAQTVDSNNNGGGSLNGSNTSSNTSSGSTSTSTGTKKEMSVYELARAAHTKLMNDRIEEIKKLTEAETKGADERIAAINAEIDARKKLEESNDLQKRIDFIKGQLEYSQLDEFERHELTKQLAELEKEQSDAAWEEGKRAEIEAIEAEKAALQEAQDAQIEELQNRINYGNSLFTDLANGYQSATTIANNNSTIANVQIIEQALTVGQVTQIIRDALGIEEVI